MEEAYSEVTFSFKIQLWHNTIKTMNEKNWLCPHCVYGFLFRVVKDEQGIPTHTEYLCVDIPDQVNKDKTDAGKQSAPRLWNPLSAPKGPGGWDGKYCPNFINNSVQKTCQFYALGKSEKKLLAYDEYDSRGSGRYYTDDVYMCDRYTYSEAVEEAKKRNLKIYLVTITAENSEHKSEIGEM
jgi:hypothetical protein